MMKSVARAQGDSRESQPAASRQPTSSAPPRILVTDDERSMRELLAIVLKREGYDVVLAENGQQGVAAIERGGIDLVVSDIKLPDMSGVDVLRTAKAADAGLPTIMMTAFASTETAVEAMRLGACDYLIKPFDVDELKIKVREKLETRQLRQENVLLKRTLNQPHAMGGMIGRSPSMLAVFDLIESVARTTSTVLVTGESGTGKELVARALHFQSLRRDRPFVAVNCGALPETLLESELFGHMRGAFTGAEATKKGLVEIAEGGTIFLDEIGEMTPMMQVKVLRVLQERRFRRVGGLDEIEADIRVVAATNQDLPRVVSEGRFREDLYYRVNVIPIQLPPLRERREDIPLIAEHFLAKYRHQMSKPLVAISGEAMTLLGHYDWPGNIRELENVIERAVALERTPAILPESLPAQVRTGATGRPGSGGEDVVSLPESGFDLEQHVQGVERRYLAQALERAGGVQVRAAELLGMSFRSFRYYAKKYNLR
jgi:two-component system, NtrC family, response regulator PilR